MIYPDSKRKNSNPEAIKKAQEAVTRKLALVYAFVGVFFFFIKILFL